MQFQTCAAPFRMRLDVDCHAAYIRSDNMTFFRIKDPALLYLEAQQCARWMQARGSQRDIAFGYEAQSHQYDVEPFA